MTPQRFVRLQKILTQRQPDLTVLMDNVHKPHNFSAILRTCDATGVYKAHAVHDRSRLKPRRGIASGSKKWLKLSTHPDIDTAITQLKAEQFQFVVADLHPGAIDFRQVDYRQPTAIVLGAEMSGPSPQILEAASHIVSIPMLGMVDSLNVSVAAALILFEAQRQRIAAGLYETSRLAADVYATTLFEWAYPKLARFYQRKKIPYPVLQEDGQIIEETRHIAARMGHPQRLHEGSD